MHLYGDQLAPNQVVTVDGRPVMADIREVNTEEGWVTIELPVFESQNIISVDEGIQEEGLPLFDAEVKKLTGKVEIMTLPVP